MLREVKLKEDEPQWLQNIKYGQTYGISNKIWTIVSGCLVLFTFSRLVLSSTDPVSLYASPDSLITAADYLNASASDPPPFAFCPVFGPGDPIGEKRGQWGLLRSRLHMGSGARVQKVIQKGLAGEAVTISVLGGSISACHGAGDDVVSPTCYPSRIFDWWNNIFPHPASQLTNGAVRKADSSYFGYCSMHHLPDQTDLIILEFDASDPNDPAWMNHFELLVRSLLVRPDAPAVIILGHFSPQIHSQNGFAGPELLHTVVAQFYDVPHISVKGLIYNPYMSDPEGQRKLYYADPVLANRDGHQLIADVVTSYLQSQICAGWAAMMGHGFDVPYMGNEGVATNEEEEKELEHKSSHTRVPQAMLSDRPSDILKFREVEPFCVTANDILNPLPPSEFSDGSWLAFHPKTGKGANEEDKHYWYAEEGGAKIRVPILLSAGDVTIHYIQTPSDEPLGNVECWVDDNVANAMTLRGNADVHGLTATLTKIDTGVSAGPHYVECVLQGEEGKTTAPFKILGIFGT